MQRIAAPVYALARNDKAGDNSFCPSLRASDKGHWCGNLFLFFFLCKIS
jgi:hypothetical protein